MKRTNDTQKIIDWFFIIAVLLVIVLGAVLVLSAYIRVGA